jgi:hypothetical protein
MLCRHYTKNRDHTLQEYPHHTRLLWRHKHFAAIQKTGNQQRSEPVLVAFLLIDGLNNWFCQMMVNPALIDVPPSVASGTYSPGLEANFQRMVVPQMGIST